MDSRHLLFIFVPGPRPKEAAQPVFSSARHDMYVQVRHALAHAIIHGHERTFGMHGRFYGPAEQLGIAEESMQGLRGQFRQGFYVCARHQERVARKQGTLVEKRQRSFIFEYHRCRSGAGDDITERA